MNLHQAIPINTRWLTFVCCAGVAFLLSWSPESAAKPKIPTTGPHICNCGCSYKGSDAKFYFQNGHNVSTNLTCAELTVSDSKCDVKTVGHTYSGVLMGCSGGGSGMGPPPKQVPPPVAHRQCLRSQYIRYPRGRAALVHNLSCISGKRRSAQEEIIGNNRERQRFQELFLSSPDV
jgi:hypothetical protein